MPGDYSVLASIYDAIGMADFGKVMTPRLINFAQRNDWLGRRIMDLGCGTGTGLEWFIGHGYSCIGLDNSPEMIEIAKAKLNNTSIRWYLEDIRTTEVKETVDLVMSLDVMHEMDNLRELEAAFKTVHRILAPSKLFIFNMNTIEGSALSVTEGERIVFDDENNLTVIDRDEFDYERQINTRSYLIFKRENEYWQRETARLIQRSYPVQAIASLLQRCGYQIKNVLDLNLEQFDPGLSRAPQVIFVAQKS